MAHPGGRPTKYKEELCDTAYDVLCRGGSLVKVAAVLDVDRDTIKEWRKTHPKFSAAIKRGLVKSEVVWEENPPEMSDTRWIFNMKNRFGWADRQSDRGKFYSENFDKEGISIMMSAGEMSVDTGIKLLELLFKENEKEDINTPINVNLVVQEIAE